MKTIHHVLDIEGGSQDIWTALTTTDGLAKWWSTTVTWNPDARQLHFTFGGDFNPVMQIMAADDGRLQWQCVSGHANWQDNTFTFDIHPLEDGRTRLRFTQDYATELSDDDYGIYNFNWGYYLESLRLLAGGGSGKPYQSDDRGSGNG